LDVEFSSSVESEKKLFEVVFKPMISLATTKKDKKVVVVKRRRVEDSK
jgi:hypothetical protein